MHLAAGVLSHRCSAIEGLKLGVLRNETTKGVGNVDTHACGSNKGTRFTTVADETPTVLVPGECVMRPTVSAIAHRRYLGRHLICSLRLRVQ